MNWMVVPVVLCLVVSMVGIADGKAAPQASLQHNQIRSNSPTTPSSSGTSNSGGGCVTKWGWDGKQYVKRDLYIPSSGKTIPGYYCTAFNPHTNKMMAKPIGEGQAYSNHRLVGNWWVYERAAMSHE